MCTVHNGVPKTRLILIVVFLAEQCKIVLQTETSQRENNISLVNLFRR